MKKEEFFNSLLELKMKVNSPWSQFCLRFDKKVKLLFKLERFYKTIEASLLEQLLIPEKMTKKSKNSILYI